jgi:hypothetical protein
MINIRAGFIWLTEKNARFIELISCEDRYLGQNGRSQITDVTRCNDATEVTRIGASSATDGNEPEPLGLSLVCNIFPHFN